MLSTDPAPPARMHATPLSIIVSAVLNAVGSSDEVASETALNILTGLSGAGPAYTALLANALWEAAVEAGLKPDIAGRAVEATVCDAATLLIGKGSTAGAIVDDFIRYEGTTAAALTAARSADFDTAVRAALAAAIRKTREIEDAASFGAV